MNPCLDELLIQSVQSHITMTKKLIETTIYVWASTNFMYHLLMVVPLSCTPILVCFYYCVHGFLFKWLHTSLILVISMNKFDSQTLKKIATCIMCSGWNLFTGFMGATHFLFSLSFCWSKNSIGWYLVANEFIGDRIWELFRLLLWWWHGLVLSSCHPVNAQKIWEKKQQ